MITATSLATDLARRGLPAEARGDRIRVPMRAFLDVMSQESEEFWSIVDVASKPELWRVGCYAMVAGFQVEVDDIDIEEWCRRMTTEVLPARDKMLAKWREEMTS